MFSVDLLPIILILHCFFISALRLYFGPQGVVFLSVIVYGTVLVTLIYNINLILLHGTFSYLDYGRWFFFFNIFDSNLIFIFDLLALICAALVSFLTPLALIFGSEYMFREAFLLRLVLLLNFFATSVILLFIAYDLFLIILAWEFIGLFSLLLVNFYSTRVFTIKAALKTFIFSRISDMFLFIFLLLTLFLFQSLDLSIIFLQIPFYMFHYVFLGPITVHYLSLLSLSLVLSGVIKSAQFGFHVWLPDAMEAPTPASALIHSSTLVVAGIFLIFRFSLLFDFTPTILQLVAVWGGLTLSSASVIAIFQKDIKKLVAYSTISQIGYLVSGCGVLAFNETLVYLIVHALNKAFLFILVGYITHFFNHNTDLRFMGGLWAFSFNILIFFISLIFNLIGLPYSAGFIGKDLLLLFFFKNNSYFFFTGTCWIVSLVCSPIYMSIFIMRVFFSFLKLPLIQNWQLTVIDKKTVFFYSTPLISMLTFTIFFSFWLVIWYGLTYLYPLIFFFNNVATTSLFSTFFPLPINPLFSLTLTPFTTLAKLSTYIYFNMLNIGCFWIIVSYRNFYLNWNTLFVTFLLFFLLNVLLNA